MSKCIACGKENDGIVCSHCLAKTASKVGNGAKKVGGFLLAVAPSLILLIATKGKGKPKI
jgi:hypothetical protein